MDRVRVGNVSVDAGLVWVGDPCYVLGADASHAVPDWDTFCHKLDVVGHDTNGMQASEPLGDGVGFAIYSGYGDGIYPVYVEYSDEGRWGKRVKSVTIEFITDEDEEDSE